MSWGEHIHWRGGAVPVPGWDTDSPSPAERCHRPFGLTGGEQEGLSVTEPFLGAACCVGWGSGDPGSPGALLLSALSPLVLWWLLQQWKSLLSALLGNVQSLPSASLLAELASLCSELSKQSWWSNKTNQGRRCCQPGRLQVKARFKRKVSLCRSFLRCETQILAAVFPNLKDSHWLSRRLGTSIIMHGRKMSRELSCSSVPFIPARPDPTI